MPPKATPSTHTAIDPRCAPQSPKRARVSIGSAGDLDLTPTMKTALISLKRAGADALATFWRTPAGERIENKTIYALYDRYLVKMVLDSRHRKRTTALLTDLGEHAARGVEIGEADKFEDATLIYGDGEA